MKKIVGIVFGILVILGVSIVAIYMYSKHIKNEEKLKRLKEEEQSIAEEKEATKDYRVLFDSKYPEIINIGYNIGGYNDRDQNWKLQMVLSTLSSETVTTEELQKIADEIDYHESLDSRLVYNRYDYPTVLAEYRRLFGDSTDLEEFINNGLTNGFIPNDCIIHSDKGYAIFTYSSKIDSIVIVDYSPYSLQADYNYVYRIYGIEGHKIEVEVLQYEKTSHGYFYYSSSKGLQPLDDISEKNLEHLLYRGNLDFPRIEYTFKDGETGNISDYILVSIQRLH